MIKIHVANQKFELTTQEDVKDFASRYNLSLQSYNSQSLKKSLSSKGYKSFVTGELAKSILTIENERTGQTKTFEVNTVEQLMEIGSKFGLTRSDLPSSMDAAIQKLIQAINSSQSYVVVDQDEGYDDSEDDDEWLQDDGASFPVHSSSITLSDDMMNHASFAAMRPKSTYEPVQLGDVELAKSNIPVNITHKSWNEMSPAEQDAAYKLFADEYTKSTGKAWDRSHFEHRASGWTFAGTPTGYVAYRIQRSGPVKINGAAGDIRSKHAAMQSILATGKPVWTAVTKQIADGLVKHYGMKILDADSVKRIMPILMQNNVMGDAKVHRVEDDGGITGHMDSLGKDHIFTKYIIGNDSAHEMMSKAGY